MYIIRNGGNKKMNILGLNGSPKEKSDTMILTRAFLKGLEKTGNHNIKIIDVMKNRICSECGSPTNAHKKECSHYRILTICSECGGKRGQHFSTCSKFTKRTFTDATRRNMSIAAKNRPRCPECGSQINTHKKGCSKYKPPKTYTCEVCGRTIANKGNLKQHMAAHERRGEC